jgi:PAS domain S-box-containing protein
MTDEDPTNIDLSLLSSTDFQAVFHAVNAAIFVHDSDGTIIDVNKTAAEMYGYSRTEMREDDVGIICSGIPPYTEATAREQLQRAADGEVQRFEWQGQTRDGTVFWEEVSLSRTVVDGEVRVLAIVRDIDERKEAERRLQTLLDNLPGIVYRTRNEPGWPMEYVGGKCQKLTGYEVSAIESGAVSWGEDLIHDSDQERVQEVVQTAVANNDSFEITYRIQTAAGAVRWVWERGQQVDIPGRPDTILEGFISDITTRKQYEQDLEEQRDDFETLNQVLRHDIRNDLQIITAHAELLAEELDDADSSGHVETIRDSASHAVGLTKTARDTAEMLQADPGERQKRNLKQVLTAEIDEVRSTYPGAAVMIDDELVAVTVQDNGLLDSAFRNILENAIQHNDTQLPEISISATAEDEIATIEIADNGPGIPDSQKHTIFGKGEKGLESAGTGLGLYLVDNIVAMHGGEIRVEDNDPEGTVFIVELPIVG